MSQLFYLLITLKFSWAITNWPNWENTTIENLKKQYSITIFTEKNCQVCPYYLKEILSCEIVNKSKVAIVAVGDDNYLRKLKRELPNTVTLFKTTRKDLLRMTHLTPTTLINQKVINGFHNCKTITREFQSE